MAGTYLLMFDMKSEIFLTSWSYDFLAIYIYIISLNKLRKCKITVIFKRLWKLAYFYNFPYKKTL